MLRLSAAVDWRRQVGGRSLLGWQMRELQRWGIDSFVLVAPAAGLPELGRLAASLPKRAYITLAATGDAAADEPVLLVRSEGVAAGDLGPALAAFAGDPAGAGRKVMFAAHGRARESGIVLAASAHPGHAEPDAATVVAGEVIDGAAAGLAARIGPLRRPALLLDRDGVLNCDHGYVGTWARWEWMRGAVAAVRQATARGWHVFVVTNQSGVARGLFGEDDVAALHRRMTAALQAGGGTVDDLRTCPFHPDGTVGRYRRESDWRKPAPGMVLDLMRAWELDAARCVLIGDQARDLAAAQAAGVRGHLFSGGDLGEFVETVLSEESKARGFAPGPH